MTFRLGSRIAGVYREDFYELPIDSIREMISNAVCHRSYVSPGSIQVAIYDDRLEVTSPGRISPDLTIEQLKAGNSRLRNVAIGAAFQYMHIIEKWGTGIPRILKEAAEYGLRELMLKDFGTSFRIDIFRKPFETDPFGVVQPLANDAEHQSSASSDAKEAGSASSDAKEAIELLLSSLHVKNRNRAMLILNCMLRNPHMTAVQIGNEIGLSKATVQRAIDGLKAAGIVSRRGSNNGGQWVIASPQHITVPTEES